MLVPSHQHFHTAHQVPHTCLLYIHLIAPCSSICSILQADGHLCSLGAKKLDLGYFLAISGAPALRIHSEFVRDLRQSEQSMNDAADQRAASRAVAWGGTFGVSVSGSWDYEDDCSASGCATFSPKLSASPSAAGGLQPIALVILGCMNTITTASNA